MRTLLKVVTLLMASLWLGTIPVRAVETDLPIVDVYLSRTTDILVREERDPYTAAAVDKLKLFMDRSGLEYRFHYVPWSRAMRLVTQSDHALIFQLLRTPERETRFHWLMPVFESEPLRLIALADSRVATLTLPEIVKGTMLIGCQKATAHCAILKKLGIAADRIKEIPIAEPTALEQMLLRERVDLITAYHSAARNSLMELGENPDRVVGLDPIDNSDDYLAAPAGISPTLLRQLQDTDQDGLPILQTPK